LKKQQRILIIKHGALGDMIFAHGAFQAIRTFHAQDHIVLLTTPPYKTLAEAMSLFDEVWVEDRPRPLKNPIKCWKLFQRLAKGKFDRVYDLQKSKRTRFYLKIMQSFFNPCPLWCSKHVGADFAYTDSHQNQLHIYDRHKKLLETAGIREVPTPHAEWLQSDIKQFQLPKKYFLFVPGCSPTQPHKRWPADRYGAIGNWLVDQGITPVIIGRSEEKEAILTIQKICPKAINLMNQTTLFDLGPLGRGAVGALGHDTGPMHIIAVTHCPSLLLFSYSSVPEHYAPRGFKTEVIQSNNLRDLSIDVVEENLASIIFSKRS
jgi:ADP-heptose:LPS heptosyltransferase